MHHKFADPRLRGLVMSVHAEMVAGFPSGRLFLDSVEQAVSSSEVVQRYREPLAAWLNINFDPPT